MITMLDSIRGQQSFSSPAAFFRLVRHRRNLPPLVLYAKTRPAEPATTSNRATQAKTRREAELRMRRILMYRQIFETAIIVLALLLLDKFAF
jgi:hypothetical protein